MVEFRRPVALERLRIRASSAASSFWFASIQTAGSADTFMT